VDERLPDNAYEGFFFRKHKELVIETYAKDGEGDGPAFKIMLSALSNRKEKEFLFSYDRTVSTLRSPNEEWIVINDRPLRGQCKPRLFRRVDGLRFQELKSAQIAEKVIGFFVRTN